MDYLHGIKCIWNPTSHHTKINSKWITDLNMKEKTTKF